LSRSYGRSVIEAAAAFSVPFAKCMDASRQNLRVMDSAPIEDTARWLAAAAGKAAGMRSRLNYGP
jgi:hypothetical protein